MFFYCVEPAHQQVKNRDNYHGWTFTIRQGLGHHLIFPHVDSCLGVICQLPDRRVFAGHINGVIEEGFNYQRAFDNLVTALDGRIVINTAIFGDLPNWRAQIDNFPSVNRVEFNTEACRNGVDVFFDVDSGVVKVMRYMKNRTYRSREHTQVVANENLYEIAGNQLVVC